MTIPSSLNQLNDYLQSQPFAVRLMSVPAERAGSEFDLQELLGEARQGYDWVVLDNYYFSVDYQKEVQGAGCLLAVIDDRREVPSCADILVSLSLAEPDAPGPSGGSRETLAGPRYVPIREELLRLSKKKGGGIQYLLVTLGGSRQTETLLKIVRALKIVKNPKLVVKVWGGFEETSAALGDDHAGIEFHKASIDNHKFYEWADLAVTAAGGTVWELCYFGIPAVVGALSADQAVFGGALGRSGACEYLGEYARIDEGRIAQAIENLLCRPDRITALKSQSMELVDGKGAQRIVAALRKMETGKVKAREGANA